jgi:ferredoxin
MILELLLARCPSVPKIRELANRMGVIETRFKDDADTCILCGLCTRVCQTYATTSIAVLNRGYKKSIGTVADAPPEDCVGCGACAQICPTGHITDKRSAGRYEIWNRKFATATCAVDPSLCRGCGACEEACPFAVPRVTLQKDGAATAHISIDACRGCGVCFAVCPSRAIVQPRAQREQPAIGASSDKVNRLMVIACPRSKLSGPYKTHMPDHVKVVELPCSGGVSTAMLLSGLATGFDGVLVLSRHQTTCRFDGAEHLIGSTVERADALSELVGLGPKRVGFAEPEPGPEGPKAAVNRFLATLEPSPLKTSRPSDKADDSLTGALDTLKWLSKRPELHASGHKWLSMHGLPPARSGRPALIAGGIPYLDLLLQPWLAPFDLGSLLVDGLAVLRALGIDAGVAVGGFRAGDAQLAERFADSKLFSLCNGCGDRLTQLGLSVQTIDALLYERGGELNTLNDSLTIALDVNDKHLIGAAGAIGFNTTDVGADSGRGLTMDVSKPDLSTLDDRLSKAAAAGASALAVAGPAELVQYLLQVRRGSWRRVHIQPRLISSLTAAALV